MGVTGEAMNRVLPLTCPSAQEDRVVPLLPSCTKDSSDYNFNRVTSSTLSTTEPT
jgi:hypothetical protein